MKEMKTKREYGILEVIIIAITGFFILFVDVFAAEGFFGDPSEWNSAATRLLCRVCGTICLVLLFLIEKVKKKNKWEWFV